MSDLIERQAAIDAIDKAFARVFVEKVGEKTLRYVPSVQSDLPIKEKCAFCPHCNNCDVNDDLSIQPCVDTISRRDAIDALDKRFDSIPMEQTTEILLLRKDLRELPPAQPEKRTQERTETHSCDLIERQAAIDTEGLEEEIRCEMCKNPMHTDRGCDGNCEYDQKLYEKIIQILDKRITPFPSAQPGTHEERTERTCDCIERKAAIDALHGYFDGMLETDTWSPCDVYGLIEILPPAQPEIVRCKDCMYWVAHDKRCVYLNHGFAPNMWCCHAERRTDEQTD